MRIDFGDKHPSVKFTLDPGELEIELKTGKRISFQSLYVDFWDKCVVYKSSDDIRTNAAEISDTSKATIEQHATNTIVDRLGMPGNGPDSWEVDWDFRWPGHTHDDTAEVHSEKPEKGCHIILILYHTAKQN